MANIWLPAESDFALALREPNLLVPGVKPTGQIRVKKEWLGKGLTAAWIFGPGGAKSIISNRSVIYLGGVEFGNNYVQTGGSKTTRLELQIADEARNPPLSVVVDGDHISGSVDWSYLNISGDVWSGIYSASNQVNTTQNNSFDGQVSPSAGAATKNAIASSWSANSLRASRAGGAVVEDTSCALTSLINTNAICIGASRRQETSIDNYSVFRCRVVLAFNAALSDIDLITLSSNAYIVFEPANDTPYLFPVAGGGGVSGTGDLVGAGSEVVGTGTRTVTVTGALEGQGAAVVGTATRIITGTGALVGQGSDVAGAGATGGTHTGVGDLVAAGSEIVGVGERTVTGTGALVAQGSAVAGVGERTVTGSGDLVGAGAEVSGSGAIGGITTGTGDLVGAGSEIVGTGLRTVTGSGALVAQGSAVAGTGERSVTGAGALVGSGSEIVGAGVGGDVTTGAGALVGQGSAVTGTGTRTITGVGELVAAGSIIVGSGLRTITGSGALVGAGSEVVGTYVATIVEPSLFQSAADTIIDVFAAAHGQTITLALDSGTVTITGFMRKRPKDWNTPDGKMRGSGWQIVCKGWEISTSDLEGMSGKRATVDGAAYYIVSATPKTSGTLVLDVGYAN